MPTPNNEQVRLLVGGLAHDDWEHYDIEADLLQPADCWQVTLGLRDGKLPASVRESAKVEIRVGDDLVMVSRIDGIDRVTAKDRRLVRITGRDGAANLVDCSAPVFVARLVGLEEIIAKVAVPLGLTQWRIDADATRRREKINVEPGDRAWEVLSNAAEANGLWPWVEPDGTLVIGGPDYAKPPVATLILRTDGGDNNVIRLQERDSIQGRYSEVTVLGQTHGTHSEPGKHGLKATAYDKGVEWYRPLVVVDHEADSAAVCRDRARKLLADSRLKGYTLTAEVLGHRIVAPGEPSDGQLWAPGQRIRVISEPDGIDAVYFLMARRFSGGRREGPRTDLVLKEDGAWVLDAHPHKRRHRLGKHAAPVQILDVSKGAAQ